MTSPKPTDPLDRVIRGGGWFNHDAVWVRAANRNRRPPAFRDDFMSFRLTQTGCRQQVLKVTR